MVFFNIASIRKCFLNFRPSTYLVDKIHWLYNACSYLFSSHQVRLEANNVSSGEDFAVVSAVYYDCKREKVSYLDNFDWLGLSQV